MRIQDISKALAFLAAVIGIASCSSTKSVPEGDRLYTGLKPIKYQNYEKSDHFYSTQEEVEAALATAPNGAFFGSSYHRTIPYRLWIWNAFNSSEGKAGKWIAKTFGQAPVLMSWVNPELRASVAKSVLRNHGYFSGNVKYDVNIGKNPKKAKIAYTVDFNNVTTVDTLEYVNFPDVADSLINATKDQAVVKTGDPLDVARLDAERVRLANLFRNNGYYYYQSPYASYLADSLNEPNKVQLRLQLADNIPEIARHKWYIGNLRVNIMKKTMEQLKDSFIYRRLSIFFNGKKPKIRARLLLSQLRLFPKQMYSYSAFLESADRLNNSGQYSSVQFSFTPRDTTASCDTLDMAVSCVLNKPYESYIETNYSNKINGRTGPEVVLGLKKLNAFRGGEVVDLNVHGSYEWQTKGVSAGSSDDFNSYEYGADLSVTFPRLIVPFLKRRRYFTTPSTTAKASTNVLNRPGYFKMHTASGEWTYKWQNTEKTKHEYSPLTLKYQHLTYATHKFDSIMNANPYLLATMQDMFIPKMSYTFTYTSPKQYRNPIYWSITASAGRQCAFAHQHGGRKEMECREQETVQERLCAVCQTGERLHQDVVHWAQVAARRSSQCRRGIFLWQHEAHSIQRAVLCGRCQQREGVCRKEHRPRRLCHNRRFIIHRPDGGPEVPGQSGIPLQFLRQSLWCYVPGYGQCVVAAVGRQPCRLQVQDIQYPRPDGCGYGYRRALRP